MYKRFLFLVITLLSIQIGFSQNIDTLKLNNYFKSLDLNNKFMGSVALLKDGKTIYTHQIGFTDINTNKKPNKNTKYRIGSISKTFTAALIFKAIEEGKIDLNQTIEKYFPSIKNSKIITISNLLNHRSGIYNFTNDKAYSEYNTKAKNEKEMVAIIAKADSDFTPNSKAAYSNSNYVLLSYILEKIYKKPFSKILNEQIIKPLNLKNTCLGGKISVTNNESNSYIYLREWEKQTETDTSIPLGAGGIVSTPSDLLLFSEALFNYNIVSKESLTKMTTLQDNYGMGLFKMPFHDMFSYGHTGGIDGFRSVFGYFPKEKCAFALTSNGTNYDNNKISIALLSTVFNKNFDIPTFETYTVRSEDLDQYLGTYASPSFPLKITITKSNNILIAQATGQPSFNLEATNKDEFKFDQAGIVLKFNTADKQMTLEQGGGVYKLTRE